MSSVMSDLQKLFGHGRAAVYCWNRKMGTIAPLYSNQSLDWKVMKLNID